MTVGKAPSTGSTSSPRSRTVASRTCSCSCVTGSKASPTRSGTCGHEPSCKPHLFTLGVAGWSRRSPAPSQSEPVQRCCLRGPDADLSGWGGGGPCICQRDQRRSERRDEVPTRPAATLIQQQPSYTEELTDPFIQLADLLVGFVRTVLRGSSMVRVLAQPKVHSMAAS